MAKPLTSKDIYDAINDDVFSSKTFMGVYAKDRLPMISFYPCSFVFNTDPSSKPGQHWLAIYFNKDHSCEVFDSYGNPPEFYQLNQYLNKWAKHYEYNNTRLQEWGSSMCGYYCIFFILLKNRFFSLNEVVDMFSKHDFGINDYLVEHVIYS